MQLNSNMIDYLKPTMADVPPVDKKFLETRAGNAAYGASGISHSLASGVYVISMQNNQNSVSAKVIVR